MNLDHVRNLNPGSVGANLNPNTFVTDEGSETSLF